MRGNMLRIKCNCNDVFLFSGRQRPDSLKTIYMHALSGPTVSLFCGFSSSLLVGHALIGQWHISVPKDQRLHPILAQISERILTLYLFMFRLAPIPG